MSQELVISKLKILHNENRESDDPDSIRHYVDPDSDNFISYVDDLTFD